MGPSQAIYAIPAQSLPRLEQNTGLRIEKIPWPGAPRIWLLNTTKPPLDDVRVRRAINYAVDKDALLATVAKGTIDEMTARSGRADDATLWLKELGDKVFYGG